MGPLRPVRFGREDDEMMMMMMMMMIVMMMMMMIKATSDGTTLSYALRLPKEHLLFGRLSSFARLSFWQQLHLDENEYGALVERRW